jgi:hypothetical protein
VKWSGLIDAGSCLPGDWLASERENKSEKLMRQGESFGLTAVLYSAIRLWSWKVELHFEKKYETFIVVGGGALCVLGDFFGPIHGFGPGNRI